MAARLAFKPVTAARWSEFEAFFEGPGGPKYCWCMAFRTTSLEARTADSAARKVLMHKRIAAGTPVGILGYRDDEPIAWVSIAPKQTYERLGGPEPEKGEKVWSLACMYLRRPHRGEGLAHALIAGAIAHARRHKADIVEAYPVDPQSPSYRFMGFVSAFEAAGFAHVERVGSRRHVMRLRLG